MGLSRIKPGQYDQCRKKLARQMKDAQARKKLLCQATSDTPNIADVARTWLRLFQEKPEPGLARTIDYVEHDLFNLLVFRELDKAMRMDDLARSN